MSWWEYVERTARTARQRDIAETSGIDATNISRWKTAGQIPGPTLVAQFARAYDRPVLEAFVAAGFLTAEEARARPAAAPDLSQLTNDDLLRMVRARMTEERGEHGGDTAATNQAGPDPAPMTKGDYALSARRGRRAPTPADVLDHAGEESQDPDDQP